MNIHGVFIGIDKYKDKRITPLKYAKADAVSLFTHFKSKISDGASTFTLIADQDATRRTILEVLGEKIPRVSSSNDLLLFFWAGHGSPETTKDIDKVSRYIVPHDADYDSMFSTAIDMEKDLLRLFDRLSSDLIVVFMDTCFSGQAGGRTFEGPILAKQRKEWRDSINLDSMDLGEGRVIIAASDSHEVAREDSIIQHGVFSYYLLQTLSDTSSGKSISLSSLYDRVAREVREYTHGRQNPILNGRIKLASLPVMAS